MERSQWRGKCGDPREGGWRLKWGGSHGQQYKLGPRRGGRGSSSLKVVLFSMENKARSAVEDEGGGTGSYVRKESLRG